MLPPLRARETAVSGLSLLRVIAAAAALIAPQATTTAYAEEAKAMSSANTPAAKPLKSGHVTANGLKYYYQVHGKGDPLLLLHGGLGRFEMFDSVLLPALAASRQVIGVDLHGHGRTELGDRDISPIDMGDDLAVILKQLGYDQVDVLGYSLGGKVAFRLAAQHPTIVRRLVLVSVSYAQDGVYPELLPQQAALGSGMMEAMKDTPVYQSYVAVAPHPEDFPKLLDRIGASIRKPYDWSGDVKKLNMPVMLVYGDSDVYRPEHIVKFYQLLGGGLRDPGWGREHMPRNRLAILPDLTHYDIFLSPTLVSTVIPFLNGESRAEAWTGG